MGCLKSWRRWMRWSRTNETFLVHGKVIWFLYFLNLIENVDFYWYVSTATADGPGYEHVLLIMSTVYLGIQRRCRSSSHSHVSLRTFIRMFDERQMTLFDTSPFRPLCCCCRQRRGATKQQSDGLSFSVSNLLQRAVEDGGCGLMIIFGGCVIVDDEIFFIIVASSRISILLLLILRRKHTRAI